MVNVKSVGEIYQCKICGNIVEVKNIGGGELVCCGQPMNLLEEKTAEQEGKERHIPIITIEEDKIKVKVGAVPHPMEKDHYIELIELIQNGEIIASHQLTPGEEPKAEFCPDSSEGIKARALCNIHELWTS